MRLSLPKIIGKLINGISLISPKLSAKFAYYLFTTPREGKYSKSQNKQLSKLVTKPLLYNSHKIETYYWASKNKSSKTVLLIHGWESNTLRWNAFISALIKRNFNVVGLDAPAHGRSGSRVFNAILYAEFINVVVQHYKPSILIGHSVGGMATACYQNKYQNTMLTHLVLLGSPSSFKDVVSRYEHLMAYNATVKRSLSDFIESSFKIKISQFSTANKCETIKTKGLIIHDKKDSIIPVKDAYDIADAYKNARLLITDRFGHALNTKKIVQLVVDFITD